MAYGINSYNPIAAYRDPRPASETASDCPPLDMTNVYNAATGRSPVAQGGGQVGYAGESGGSNVPRSHKKKDSNPLTDLLLAPLKLLGEDPLAKMLGLGNILKGE